MLDKKVSRLIIIPDDLLLQFSFDILFYKKASSGMPFPYLIRKYSISTAYSNQLLFQTNLLKNKKQPDNLFGGFGLEYNDLTLQNLNASINTQDSSKGSRGLNKLFYSDDEVQEIRKLLNGKAWINENATKSNCFSH